MFVYPSLQFSRWVLGNEIDYLHARFREAGQRGDMMVDIETIYNDLNEYLGGERVRVDYPREPLPPVRYENPRAEDEGEEEEIGDVMILLKEVMEMAMTLMAMRSSTWH